MFEKIKSQFQIGKVDVQQNAFDGRGFTFELKETDKSIKGVLKAKVNLTMKSFEIIGEKDFDDDDLFFANGYQAWTTSREFCKKDTFKGLIKAANINKFLKHFAGLSGDYHFESYGEEGKFHGYTYCYFREKGEKEIKLYGSKSERQGFTIFAVDMKDDKFIIRKDVEGLALKAGQEYEIFDIAIIKGDMDDVMDKYFFDFVGCKKPEIQHLSGYTSWYNYFQKIDEQIILRDLNAMDPVHDDVNIFQVDDGYETFVGDWLDPCDKFPHGMKYIADKIHEKGYMAGIWLAPFNVQIRSRTYKEHPDWVIKDEKGRPMLGCQGWGGAFTLDIYNPEVREHIKHFFDVVLNEWGYDMVKLDFLYSECMMPRNNKTRGTIMCDAMDFLRECCGDKLILGCGVPLGAAFGKVDACRISCDVDLKYTGKFYNKMGVSIELPSAQNSMNNSIFRRQLNHRVFLNDPDVFFLRYSNLKFDQDQKLLLAFINHICGDVLFVSDNMEEYVQADFDTVRKIFAKSQYKILDANYTDNNKKIIIKLLDKDSNERLFWFNMDIGMGNQAIISGISPKR